MREGEQARAEVGILVVVVLVIVVIVIVKITSLLVMLERIHSQVRFLHVVERQYMLRLCPCQVGLYLNCDCYWRTVPSQWQQFVADFKLRFGQKT